MDDRTFRELAPRLIVAADFDPRKEGGSAGVRRKVLELADSLRGTGVYIKVNSALRAMGYGFIMELHECGVKVFADLKLCDIPETMELDAAGLTSWTPDLLTVMCCAGIEGMRRVQVVLPETEVLGVTVLTSFDEEDCQYNFSCSSKAGVLKFARAAKLAGLRGLILSPKELEVVKRHKELEGLTLNTPGIRPSWSLVASDDQARVMTPKAAIGAGATRIVVGRPILLAKENDEGKPQNPREAVERTLDEFADVL